MTITNNLCADIGYLSINHAGEQLCGDHVEVLETPESNSTVIVLADGLGSGVKANILSILTSKILSTMLAAGLSLEESVRTVVETLPVCKVRGVAYSTFTVIRILNNERAEIIQYDNPRTVLLRGGVSCELPFYEMRIADKKIIRAETDISEGDVFVAFSDGVEHAGVGVSYNFGWKRSDIIDFLQTFTPVGFTAKTLSTILLEETDRLYAGEPGDDATVCTVRIRRREPVSLVIGPPANRDDTRKMMSLFFSKRGKHIVCGGTTSKIAAEYLHKELRAHLTSSDPDIPPTAEIEGCDLVTEGVVTINRVLEYAQNYLADNKSFEQWGCKKDGASLIAKTLFEDATDIDFFVGRAVNPAHQNSDLPITFTIKMQLVKELADCLEKMGKRIKVCYF
ncbi:MAG: SpoIIE family protein phosphatase [Oscillospiraceae bacterium]|nr:SpoIIE family protein phosphatase [Oscillospiraceae bacterium]